MIQCIASGDVADVTESAQLLAGLTESQAEQLLVADMRTAEYTVMTSVTRNMSDGQFAALSDFVFNVGSASFRSSTLLRTVNAGDDEKTPAQFRRWVYAGGKVWPGLQRRREAEIDLYFEGLPRPRAAPSPDEHLSPVDIRTGEKKSAQGLDSRPVKIG